MSNIKEILVSKSLTIEAETGEKVKRLIQVRQLNYKTQSKVLEEELKNYSENKNRVRRYEMLTKKITRVTMSEQAGKIYNGLKKGSRTYIVNGLLRTGLTEQEEAK